MKTVTKELAHDRPGATGQALAEFLLCSLLLTLLVGGGGHLVRAVWMRFDCLVKTFQTAHTQLTAGPPEHVRIVRECGRGMREIVELKALEEFAGP